MAWYCWVISAFDWKDSISEWTRFMVGTSKKLSWSGVIEKANDFLWMSVILIFGFVVYLRSSFFSIRRITFGTSFASNSAIILSKVETPLSAKFPSYFNGMRGALTLIFT